MLGLTLAQVTGSTYPSPVIALEPSGRLAWIGVGTSSRLQGMLEVHQNDLECTERSSGGMFWTMGGGLVHS